MSETRKSKMKEVKRGITVSLFTLGIYAGLFLNPAFKPISFDYTSNENIVVTSSNPSQVNYFIDQESEVSSKFLLGNCTSSGSIYIGLIIGDYAADSAANNTLEGIYTDISNAYDPFNKQPLEKVVF